MICIMVIDFFCSPYGRQIKKNSVYQLGEFYLFINNIENILTNTENRYII